MKGSTRISHYAPEVRIAKLNEVKPGCKHGAVHVVGKLLVRPSRSPGSRQEGGLEDAHFGCRSMAEPSEPGFPGHHAVCIEHDHVAVVLAHRLQKSAMLPLLRLRFTAFFDRRSVESPRERSLGPRDLFFDPPSGSLESLRTKKSKCRIWPVPSKDW